MRGTVPSATITQLVIFIALTCLTVTVDVKTLHLPNNNKVDDLSGGEPGGGEEAAGVINYGKVNHPNEIIKQDPAPGGPGLGLRSGSKQRSRILENDVCKNEIPSRCEGNRQPDTDLEALDCILNHKVSNIKLTLIAHWPLQILEEYMILNSIVLY